VLKSRKYSDIDLSVIHRVCAEAAAKHPKKKEAVKAAKNELHCIHQSYLRKDSHQSAADLVSRLSPDADPGRIEDICLQVMGLHASTRERLADIRAVCSFIGQYLTSGSMVVDIGCGFHPFALPLFSIRPGAYVAYDINTATIDLLSAYFSRMEFPFYQARILDAAMDTPDVKADLALLLKLLPLLQRQRKSRGFHLLEEMDFAKAIVSFPLKSMGGKEKGMEAFYGSFMERNLPPTLAIVDRRAFVNEVFYVVEKR